VGLDRALINHACNGLVVGICGGMQILGKEIVDPHGMERVGSIAGLGLLDIHTTMQPRKVTRISSGHLVASLFGQPIAAHRVGGYEIHLGETRYLEGAQPFAQLDTQLLDGCVATNGQVFGSYLHGLFDDDSFRHAFLQAVRAFYKLAPCPHFDNWKQKREDSLNRLADTVRASLDMPRIFAWAGLAYNTPSGKEAQP